MRSVVYVDKKISNIQYENWKERENSFFETHLGSKNEYWKIDYDFSDYPTYTDRGGYERPTETFLRSFSDEVTKKYSDFGTDYILLLIHEDNWKSDPPGPNNGIWGTAWSYHFGNYHLNYNRFDRDNMINSVNTSIHERMHGFDSLTKVELDIEIDTLIEDWLRDMKDPDINFYLNANGFDWDRDVVHGGLDKIFDYIGRSGSTRNEIVFPIIKPYVRLALSKRVKRHEDYIKGLKSIIAILEQVVYLFRKMFNKKRI